MVMALPWPLPAVEVPDPQAWTTMVQRISSGLDIRAEGLSAVRAETLACLQALQSELTKGGNHLQQVQLLRNVAGETPWSVRSLLIQVQDLQEELAVKARPLMQQKEQLTRLRSDDAAFLDIRKDIADADPSAPELAELEPTLNRLKAIRAEEEAVLQEVDAGLASAARLLERVEAAQERGRQRFIKALAEYYFEPGESVFSVAGRGAAWADTRRWANDFQQFCTTLAHWMRWDEVLVFIAVNFALLYWVLPALWRRWRSKEALKPSLLHKTGYFLFSLGLASSLSFRMGVFTLNQFTSLGAVVLLTLGLVMVLEDGQMGKTGGGSLWRGSLLLALWALFAAGALALAAGIPPGALGVYSAASCGLAAWHLHTFKVHDRRKERTTARSLAVALLTLLALAAPFGFGPLALGLSQALFMLQLTLSAMDAVKGRLYGLPAVAEDGQDASKISVMAYPLVATVLAILYVMWLGMFIGGPGILQYVLAKRWTFGGMSLSIESLGMILMFFFALRLTLAWIKLMGVHGRFRGEKLNPAMAHTVNATVSYAAWTVFTLVSIHLMGVQLSSLTWIASGLSVGVGFGLKDIVNNFISGLIILFGGSIKKGDIIQQGKNLGEVIDVSVRNTTIRTQENTMVIIPNSTFLRGEIVNLSYQDAKTRLTIPVTVVPGTKVKKVLKILQNVAKKNENVLKDPPVEASLVRFGRLGLEFALYVWIENFLMKFETEAKLVTEIDKRFQDEKIMLAFQGVKVKYKPKGNEQQQLESQRELLRTKRKEVFSRVRPLRRVFPRLRWNVTTGKGTSHAE